MLFALEPRGEDASLRLLQNTTTHLQRGMWSGTRGCLFAKSWREMKEEDFLLVETGEIDNLQGVMCTASPSQ